MSQSQPTYCPKCKGKGKLRMLWGIPHNVRPFSKEYNTIMGNVVPSYKDYEVLGLDGCSTVVKCSLCQGSGIVFVTPANIRRRRIINTAEKGGSKRR